MEAIQGIFLGPQFIYLRCILEDREEGGITGERRSWAGGRDAAPVRGSQVITIMRMDVFIMGCVSRSTPPLPLSLSGSLEWLRLRPTSGGAGPHSDAPASLLQPLSRRVYVRAHACPSRHPPPEAAPPLGLRPRLALPW